MYTRVHVNVRRARATSRNQLPACTFQCAAGALRGEDGGSCQFSCRCQCSVLATLRGADVCLCLSLQFNVVYLSIYVKLGLVVGMTKKTSDGKEVDTLNVSTPYKMISTSLRSVDMIFLWLTFQ